MGKIQSLADVNEALELLQEFSKYINEYFEGFEFAINEFNNNEIVQSFYASGPFGGEKEKELIALRDGLKKYYDIISANSDSLIPVTREALESQRELLMNTKIWGKPDNNNNVSNNTSGRIINSSSSFSERM